ncbi:MAG: arylsulfatase [Parabacteroides gordonii]|uniref:arylsulfatase n=1 Tax=Parabacteroides gordonii TaxID=574930 RepID=UPI003A8C8937
MKKASLFLTTSLLGVSFVPGLAEELKEKQPNIIYILADDLGYAELGCYGQKLIETPNIDNLAERGMRFTQNYAGTAVSAPSRCITFTGLHSGHAYIRGNDEMGARGNVWSHEAMLADSTLEGQRPLIAGTVTIPSLLKDAGYTTGCIGKWGLGYPGSEGTPNKMGFDFFYGYNCQRQAHTYFPPFLYRNETREYLPNELLIPGTKLDKGADPYDEKSYAKYIQKAYSCDLMYDEILKFVESNKDKPFFLAWTTPLPHVPLQAPERWVKHYVNKFGTEEPYVGNKGYFPCRYPRATYAAMISYWDEQIGGLVKKLKELGLYENTVIVFTSDNGPTFNGGSDSPWFDSAHPFKSEVGWGKASIREGGIRVPMIIAWEGKVKAGTVSNHICASWDVMPTICEMAGAVTPKHADGISFLPELTGGKQKVHKYLYWEYPEGGGSKAIRMGKWKGMILNIKKEGEGKMMLFDLEKDPCEQQDVSVQHPDIVKKMRKKMKEAHEDPIIERFVL